MIQTNLFNYLKALTCFSENKNANRFKSYLCTKAIKSAALPEPSHTTTGTGGTSVTYSNTALIVFVPPSITRQTTGVLE